MTFQRMFFVTTVTWGRVPLFRNPAKAELMMDVLEHYRERKKYELHEFVIMPDHLHLLLTPAMQISLERAMQLIKGGYSYRLGKTKRGLIWQESFTNQRIRDEQDYAGHSEYIRRRFYSCESGAYSSNRRFGGRRVFGCPIRKKGRLFARP